MTCVCMCVGTVVGGDGGGEEWLTARPAKTLRAHTTHEA